MKHTSLTCPHPSQPFFSYFLHFFSLRINKPGIDCVVILRIILFISLSLIFHSQQPTLNNDLPLPHAGPSARTESLGGPGDVCTVTSLIAGEEMRWGAQGAGPESQQVTPVRGLSWSLLRDVRPWTWSCQALPTHLMWVSLIFPLRSVLAGEMENARHFGNRWSAETPGEASLFTGHRV